MKFVLLNLTATPPGFRDRELSIEEATKLLTEELAHRRKTNVDGSTPPEVQMKVVRDEQGPPESPSGPR